MNNNHVSTANIDVTRKKYTVSDPISRFANQTFFETALRLFSQIEVKDVFDWGCEEAVVNQCFVALNKRPCYIGFDLDPARIRLT